MKKVSSTELNISGAREDQVTDRARPDQLLVRVSGPIVHQEPSVPGRESQEGRREEEKVRKPEFESLLIYVRKLYSFPVFYNNADS